MVFILGWLLPKSLKTERKILIVAQKLASLSGGVYLSWNVVNRSGGTMAHILRKDKTMPQYYFTLKIVTALGCALVAGVFFAFSTFVIKALAQQPPAQGIAAMQSINITVINPLFMGAFLGTAVACIFLVVSSLLKWHQPGAIYLLLGSLLYLVGTLGVTIAFNVPLNDALAIVKPDSVDGANLWARYLVDWTFWNHIRTIAALAAALSLTIALCYPALQK